MVNVKIVNCWFSLSRVLGVSRYWAAYGKGHFLVSLVRHQLYLAGFINH